MSTAHNEILRFGTLEVDLRSGEPRKQGVRVKLQDQPFQVLRLLLQHAGELVTREELRAQIWPGDTFVDFDNSLNAAINKLREALGDSASLQWLEELRRNRQKASSISSFDANPKGRQDREAMTLHHLTPDCSVEAAEVFESPAEC
jgi:DNA-binding response OmpR family regulator